MSDFSTATTADLRELYASKLAALNSARERFKELESDIAPLRSELVERDNNSTLILNAVMAGQQKLLKATGVPADVIEAAEAKFKEMKLAKEAKRAAEKEAA